MTKYFLVLTVFLLSACEGGMGPIDPDKIFAALPGPKVPTVQDELLDSAHAAEKKGDFKQAEEYYQQALSKHPENKEIALALADACRRNGELDQAIVFYDELLKEDEKNLGAKEGKGLALLSKGDYDTPGRLFSEIMKEDPKRWKTLNAMGILFTLRNLNSEAQQYFQAALKASPDNSSVMNNLGLSQALDRQYDSAIATLSQASKSSPAGSVTRKRIDLNMALVYATAGKLDDANAIAGNYFTGAQLDNNLGLYAHLAKDNNLAKTYLNMALTESKTFYAKAWDNLQDIDGTDNSSPTPSRAKNKKMAPAHIQVNDDAKSSDNNVNDVVGATDTVLAVPKAKAKPQKTDDE